MSVSSQSPGRRCQEIPDRICGTLKHRNLRRTTINPLWEHYSQEELPQSVIHTGYVHNLRKELDCPTLGQPTTRTSQNCRGRAVATSDRSCRWDQSQNQVRDVGFVFACRAVGVLWPQSHLFRDTGGNWGQARPEHRRPDQRQTSEIPLVLSPEQVKLGLAELEFRDQLLVFLEGALGIRQGELGALRWLSCDFENMSISVQHSYYWRRGGNLKGTKTEASAKLLPMHPSLKHSLQEWRSQSLYNKPEDFVFPSERLQGSKPLDLASVLKKKIQPAFRRIGITGVGWHTFRHSVGTMLAEMGEHQLTIRDYLRDSNLHVTNKYLQTTSKTKRLAQD